MKLNPDVLLECLNQDTANIDGELEFYKINVLKKTLLKKFVPSSRASTLDVEAKERFLDINDRVANVVIADTSFMRQWRDTLYIDLMSDEFQSSCLRFGQIVQSGGVGPGASIGAEENSFLSKFFESPTTCTSRFLIEHFRSTAPELWKLAVAANPSGFELVTGSRISTVPKDKDRNRTICVEPSLNMYYQLGVKRVLESVLARKYNIRIAKSKGDEYCPQQINNKRLARLGSINGKLATIDLKDASDTISLALAEYLLPPQVFHVLNTLRSPETEILGKNVKLNMLSTMGNGFTFHIMTLMFASLLRVVYRNNNLTFNTDTFGVYGDDIICFGEVYEEVVTRLADAGFTVNLDKSFHTGFFRESCGGDYYHGHDVRGIYIKKVENEADIYSIFNRLHLWALSSDISIFRTLSYLKGLAKFQPVPRHASVHEGFIFPRVLLSSPKRDKNGAIWYRSAEIRKKVRRVGDDSINHVGALVSALGGYIEGNKVLLRPHTKKVLVVKKKTPHWDFSSDSGFNIRGFEVSWSILLN